MYDFAPVLGAPPRVGPLWADSFADATESTLHRRAIEA